MKPKHRTKVSTILISLIVTALPLSSCVVNEGIANQVDHSTKAFIEDIYGEWVDTNERSSGFIFNADNSLILFIDGMLAEGYWENSANSLTLYVEESKGEFVVFESFYEYDGTHLYLYFDDGYLTLERGQSADAKDIHPQ